MATNLRNELSPRNKYYISKDRYLELLHFCCQYPEWERSYVLITFVPAKSYKEVKVNGVSDLVETTANKRLALEMKMKMVKETCEEADPTISNYIFLAVTKKLSYVNLKMMYDIPCGRDYFYDRYRKFFWLLDKKRG